MTLLGKRTNIKGECYICYVTTYNSESCKYDNSWNYTRQESHCGALLVCTGGVLHGCSSQTGLSWVCVPCRSMQPPSMGSLLCSTPAAVAVQPVSACCWNLEPRHSWGTTCLRPSTKQSREVMLWVWGVSQANNNYMTNVSFVIVKALKKKSVSVKTNRFGFFTALVPQSCVWVCSALQQFSESSSPHRSQGVHGDPSGPWGWHWPRRSPAWHPSLHGLHVPENWMCQEAFGARYTWKRGWGELWWCEPMLLVSLSCLYLKRHGLYPQELFGSLTLSDSFEAIKDFPCW